MIHPYLLGDHARSHDTQLIRNTKTNLGLRSFENYPSNSPDLNPFENVWSYWKGRIIAAHPRTLEELEDFAYEEWENLPLNF